MLFSGIKVLELDVNDEMRVGAEGFQLRGVERADGSHERLEVEVVNVRLYWDA